MAPFIAVYCLDPPVVQHATHNGPPEATSFPLETVLKYACYPGYVTVGFAHAKCFLYNDTAQWFGPDITCKAIRCSDPDPVENGDVDRKCQTFGCRISYKCRAGYELDGRQHRYCKFCVFIRPKVELFQVNIFFIIIVKLVLSISNFFINKTPQANKSVHEKNT